MSQELSKSRPHHSGFELGKRMSYRISLGLEELFLIKIMMADSSCTKECTRTIKDMDFVEFLKQMELPLLESFMKTIW